MAYYALKECRTAEDVLWVVKEHAASLDCLTACSCMQVLAKLSAHARIDWQEPSSLERWRELAGAVEGHAREINVVQFSKVCSCGGGSDPEV